MSDLKNYFKGLFRNHENITLKETLVDLLECKNKVVRDLRTGRMDVNEQQTDLDEVIYLERSIQQQSETKSKRLLMQKQISSLNREDYEDDEAFKKEKQRIIKLRQEQIKQEKEERENKRRQMEEKVKKWTQQQKQLSKKKQMKQADEERMRKIDEQLNRVKMQRDKAATIAEKRRQIEQNLKNIEENRIKREQLMISLRSQSQDKIPLYVQYEKRAKQFEDEIKFEQNILKKNNKISKKVNYQELKNHERMFLTKIEERNRKFEQSRARASSSMPNSQFNVYVSRSEQKVKQDLEKKNKRWKYQQKIKQIPIEIDESKRVKIEIALDKAKNPFKYNFLSQKRLNQFQIFGEFKNFSLNNDPKQLGKSYFQEVKKMTRQSRIQKSNSVHLLKQAPVSQRPQYRNYLAEMQQRRPQRKNEEEQKDEFKKIAQNYKDKDRALKELQRKTEQLDNNFLSKVKELKKIDKIQNVLTKQSEIDDSYTRALKAKLTCLQMVT